MDSKVEQSQTFPKNPETSRPLTPELGADIFFASFEHSQGFIWIQYELFKFIKALNPGWKIDELLKVRILENVIPRIQLVLAHSKPSIDKPTIHEKIVVHGAVAKGKKGNIKREAEERLIDMQYYLKNTQELKDADIETLAVGMLILDETFLRRPNARTRENTDHSTPRGDPFLSYVCYYGLAGNTTGIPEFDKIYKLINDFLRKSGRFRFNISARKTLNFVISTYNSKHPNAQVTL